MDNSGTSGSMQSSSGGDDQEQESSPAHGYSTSTVSNNFGPRLSNPSANNYLFTSQQDCFSSHNNTINSLSPRSNFPGRLDQVWSRSAALPSLPPNATSSTLQSLVALGSSSAITPPNSLLVAQANHSLLFPSSSHPMLQQSEHHHQDNQSVAALPEKPVPTRKPKKRNRASRRSPTTVMVTDTSNFRSMVQEFTGIPSIPPFAGSPYSGSRGLDWFGTAGRGRSRSSTNLEQQLGSLYHPLKPTAHKPITNPFVSSSSLPNINVWDSSMLQNPNVSFQSLLQSPDVGTSAGYSAGMMGANKSQDNSMYNGVSLNQDMGMLDPNIGQQLNPASNSGLLGGNDGRDQLRSEDNHSVQAKEKFG